MRHMAHIVRTASVILFLVPVRTLPPAVAFVSYVPGVALPIDTAELLIALLPIIINNHKSNGTDSFSGESREVGRQLPEPRGSVASARGNRTALQM